MPEPAPTAATKSFESALSELETLVQSIESGKLSLEESLSAYQRGMELLKYCQGTLNDAEQRVQVLEAGALDEFPPAAGAEED